MNNRQKLEAAYYLMNMTPVLRWKSIKEIIQNVGSLDKIWDLQGSNLKNLDLNEDKKNKLQFKLESTTIHEIHTAINHSNSKIALYEDLIFPKRLKMYQDSPYMLFYQGDFNLINDLNNIAIIGTRNISSYGKSLVESYLNELKFNNTVIITGTASGTEQTVIEESIKNNIKCVSILVSGINKISPTKTIAILNDLTKKNGCIISEFLPDTPSFKSNYKDRARLTALLASKIVLIEASISSGTLITAKEAFKKGKMIYCPISYYNDENFEGSHKLISEKIAFPILNISDIKDS